MVRIGVSNLEVFPLALGGNVFGWTAPREESFAVLDAYRAGGGNFLDTADSYSAWAPGNSGGESEIIIGAWLASRRPADIVVATKVSQHPQFSGLSAVTVRQAARASLTRLGVERIDLYYAHFDDPTVPLEETVAAFGALVEEGLVGATGVSNYSADRIRAWVAIADELGVARPVAVQPHYNLVHREPFKSRIAPVVRDLGLGVIPYYGLASGFLTGKYRTPAREGASPRAAGAAVHATRHGLAILDTLESIGRAHGASIATTALAWLRQQPGITAPIASASRASQVADLLASATLNLSDDELAELDRVSR